MELILYLVFFWLIPTGIAAAISLPIIILGRHRVRWRVWELLAFVLPFAVWFALRYCFPLPSEAKGIANMGEPIYFTAGIPIVILLRVLVGKRIPETVSAVALIAILCAAAASVYFFTPNLGGSF